MEKNKENILIDNDYWINGKWKQPPVKITHGDLVDVICEGYGCLPLLGRYIGKGYGVVELNNYITGTTHIIGKVIGRGLDRNPRLISDENLFAFIKD